MDRIIRKACCVGLACAALAATGTASAQLRTMSRHTADEARQAAEAKAAEWERAQSLYDDRDMESMLELGNGSLRGVMSLRMKSGPTALNRALTRASTSLADREWVILFPVTPYVEAWHRLHDGVSTRALQRLDPRIWKYAGRVRTDTKGNFEFDGLKPGRYLVFAEFPFAYTNTHYVDSGRRRMWLDGWTGSGGIDPIYDRVSTRHSAMTMVSKIVDVKEGVVTRFKSDVEVIQ